MLDKKSGFTVALGSGCWPRLVLDYPIRIRLLPIKSTGIALKLKPLFSKVCMDCHSHETKWPLRFLYCSDVVIIHHHVDEGREHFNVSAGILDEAYEAAEEYEEGKMPEGGYIYFHPEDNCQSQAETG